VVKANTAQSKPNHAPSLKYEQALQAINACTKRTKLKALGNGRDLITIRFGDVKAQYNTKSAKWTDPERARPFYGLNAFLQWARAMDRR
jgi:hypothetical protein